MLKDLEDVLNVLPETKIETVMKEEVAFWGQNTDDRRVQVVVLFHWEVSAMCLWLVPIHIRHFGSSGDKNFSHFFS